MRRKDREMGREFALGIIDKCAFATLSVVDGEGQPYCVPLSIVRVDDMVYFHCAQVGKKIDNLRIHPKVCVSCVGDVHIPKGKFTAEYESAVIWGMAAEVTNETEKICVLRALCERHTPNNMENFDAEILIHLGRTAVWGICMEEIIGKQRKCNKGGQATPPSSEE